MSAKTVSGPKLIRTVPAAVRLSSPMAVSTWLAFPRWQAEPAEIQIPFPSSSPTMFWLGYPGRDTDRMWGALADPMNRRSGIALNFSQA